MRSRCPTCGKQAEVDPNRPTHRSAMNSEAESALAWRPFCSRRCKMIDLGNWLDEVYRFSRPVGPDEVMDDKALLSQLMASAQDK